MATKAGIGRHPADVSIGLELNEIYRIFESDGLDLVVGVRTGKTIRCFIDPERTEYYTQAEFPGHCY